MNDELKKIIENSNFEVQDGTYIYAKVSSKPVTNHFMVSQDKDEITVITPVNKLDELDLIEKNKDNYKLIALRISVPFYSVGFLAAVSGAIAEEEMNVLIVSTYSKDYIMVKEDKLDRAKKVLSKLGFGERK